MLVAGFSQEDLPGIPFPINETFPVNGTSPINGAIPTVISQPSSEGGFKWWYLIAIVGGAIAIRMLGGIAFGGPKVEVKRPKKIKVELVPTLRRGKEN